ncbi:MAG: histidinol-phosphatase HisJ family protein [Bacteroidota bacterium]|nr:histidinol-phosphatase [Odoribacter sp.]MDP3642765.1 histidinol-phosphatase HisJ family protein [Bacteroidota bacterium]
MMGIVDYHMHSVLSDGQNSYEEMVLASIAKGLDEIGFSDHVCLKPVEWAIRIEDIPVMTSQILDLKLKYEGQIKIKYGIELDYFPGREGELKELIESIPLDYVIGSVHFIGNWNFDSDQSLYGKWSNDKLYAKYFHLIQQAARSDLFDIIGHLDIIKKFRVYPETNQDLLFEDTLRIIKEHNLVVELNTGGLDRPCSEFYPGEKLLELCYKYNIPVTLGSDAHQMEQIARHYENAFELLAHIGYKEITGFNNRTRRLIRL